MDKVSVIALLRCRRSLLLKVYIVHVGLFTSTCAFASTEAVHVTVATSFWLTLITIPPVLFYTVLVDKSCRAIDPTARTAGLVKVILFTLLLTPYESSLVLPAKNLWVAHRIIRAWDKALAVHSNGRSPTARAAKFRR